MKINTIYHPRDETCRGQKNDILRKKFSRNSVYHPFMVEREYVRALNATKIDRLLAKPFVTAFSYHKEGICYLSRHQSKPTFASASFDGQVFIWDMLSKQNLNSFTCKSHIKGLVVDTNNNVYAGQLNTVLRINDSFEYKCSSNVTNLDLLEDLCASTFDGIQIFDTERINPKLEYKVQDCYSIVANPSFRHIVGFSNLQSVSLLDKRCNEVFYSMNTGLRTNKIAFNPMEGYIFVSANEDSNTYLHDIRNSETVLGIFRGHVSSVTDVCFNPRGDEIATGSFDKTVRIFRTEERKSRDVYYNKRMQNIYGVQYSHDGQFIVTGSDDGALRLWKAEASKKLGPVSKQEKDALDYCESIKEKYKDVNEIRRISRHRFMPKQLKNKMKEVHESYMAQERRKNKTSKDSTPAHFRS